MIDFRLWKDALLKPEKTFSKEKSKASLTKAMKNIFVAGIIAGVITTIRAFNLTELLSNIILSPIASILGLLLISGLYYIFAKLLGGKGAYTVQTYLISLYTAPLSIIGSLIALLVPATPTMGEITVGFLAPFIVFFLLALVLFLYTLYLLTLALKETHKYTVWRAILSWLLVILIMVLVLMALVGVAFMAFMGGFSPISEIPQLLV
ncbi:MAG: YIP1 family protein [Candidatus Aenigmatarchaeota archaeon]